VAGPARPAMPPVQIPCFPPLRTAGAKPEPARTQKSSSRQKRAISDRLTCGDMASSAPRSRPVVKNSRLQRRGRSGSREARTTVHLDAVGQLPARFTAAARSRECSARLRRRMPSDRIRTSRVPCPVRGGFPEAPGVGMRAAFARNSERRGDFMAELGACHSGRARSPWRRPTGERGIRRYMLVPHQCPSPCPGVSRAVVSRRVLELCRGARSTRGAGCLLLKVQGNSGADFET
jgi:hypothetical protein